MKAVVYYKYGPPEVLKLEEVEKPVPQENEVLIKVKAASVNPLDWHSLRGTPFLQRLSSGLLKPKSKILGADVAGVVEANGPNARLFQAGNEVFGDLYWNGYGAFAEYVCIPEHALALKPANVKFEEAAATPQGALTALHALRDEGQLQPGQKVLINGASGGVGTFMVQMAKSFGAEVTGVCSSRNLDLVRSIGADQVVDYTQEDFTLTGQHYDLVIDNVGNYSPSELVRAVSPGGICVVVGFSSLSQMLKVRFRGPKISKTLGKKIGILIPKENKDDLQIIKDLLESGKLVPVIDNRYTLSEVPEAIRYLEGGHARGKVVITV